MHRNGATRIVPHDVPFLDSLFDANFFDPGCQLIQVLEIMRRIRRSAKPRKIHRDALELARQCFHHAVPESATRRNAVKEQHRISTAPCHQVHD
jgi:hypothetical protein